MEKVQEKDNEILVEVKGVSKKFSKNLKRSLWYGLKDILRKSFGLAPQQGLRKDEFWSVKEVSFTLRRGECIGLIGHNGAGKSTLLKVLNGLYAPDKGEVIMRGKVGALIELGAGFNPILTGRENIYNNAAVLGFTKEEVNERMSDIIDFSEIEDFLDMPVKNYSSGMKVRLGFAVAAFMNPDVLIIDEVLAVGDLGFILKCFKKIDEILPHTAVIFVSHNMPMVSRICNEIILMDHGQVNYQGSDVGKGIDLYYKKFSNNNTNVVFDNGLVEVRDIKLNGNNDKVELKWGQEFIIELDILKKKPIDTLYVYVVILDKEQRPVAELKSKEVNFQNQNNINLKFVHDKIQLSKGNYSINLKVDKIRNKFPVLRINQVANFQILDEEEIWTSFLLDTKITTS